MASLPPQDRSPLDRTPVRWQRTLVLGGTRSGKSAYAEDLATGRREVTYVATGRRNAGDADWEARIDAHRHRRPAYWTTVETSAGLPSVLVQSDARVLTIVDDLGTWLTGAIDDLQAWDLPRGTVAPSTDALVDAVVTCESSVIMVSPEVGWSVVPPTRSGRLFQDEMGILNRRIAAVCDTVVLVVAGIPLTIKDARSTTKGHL
ncbi:MAG: bifunctional adenosylcobinamide kinase/adenosylcobinamide-phosphate guanylyltransferase [Rhodococcus sp. (in: high G+C Gram-positive bacteria)]